MPGWPSPKGAERLIDRQRRKRISLRTLGADKGYHNKAFVEYLRLQRITPHIARIHNRRTPGLDGRTTRHESYRISQRKRKRKRIEEIFGWLKTVGGLRKTRFIGIEGTQLHVYLAASAYNLLRMAQLGASVASHRGTEQRPESIGDTPKVRRC